MALFGMPPIVASDQRRIADGYFQRFELIEQRSGSLKFNKGDSSMGLGSGLLYFSETLLEDFELDELIYVDDGSEVNRVNGIAGAALLMNGLGWGKDEELFAAMRKQLENVRKLRPAVVLVLVERFGKLVDFVHPNSTRLTLAYESEPTANSPAPQVILMEREGWSRMFPGLRAERLVRKKPGSRLKVGADLRVDGSRSRVFSDNVLGYIEGTELKDEVVVLTAHYDHIGVEDGVVYNGADDDGSGTVALLEIAQAFLAAKAAGHGPRRSILIMPVSGEEKGLLGSRYYSDHPVFPLEQTVANLNIDMIGRVDSAHAEAPPYVYIIGSDRLSTELHQVNEGANELVGLKLDYVFNAEDDPNRFYYRSDHYNFARKGIPCIFYFSGVHEDYHQPGDDVEKIRFDLLRQRTALVFQTAWELANRSARIAVDRPAR
ncbi:MAG: M28 family peptidase [Flavobacteriales bacterium]|nr:M28 family peptidase [Flavobacteriales bacterium]